MIRDIVAPRMTRREARAAFLAAGWSFVGGGSFAAVFGSPDGTRVAKVTKPDRGAEATYSVAMELAGNPYLPRYFDMMPLANGGNVYEVERLLPLSGYSEQKRLEKTAGSDPRYDEALEALDFASPGWGVNDFHWRNAMKRATGELVMTDYLADMDALSNATVSAGDVESGVLHADSRHGSNHWLEVAA